MLQLAFKKQLEKKLLIQNINELKLLTINDMFNKFLFTLQHSSLCHRRLMIELNAMIFLQRQT